MPQIGTRSVSEGRSSVAKARRNRNIATSKSVSEGWVRCASEEESARPQARLGDD